MLPLLLVLHTQSNSAGADPACFDGVDLCKLACPNDKARPWASVLPPSSSNAGSLAPCCPAGMDMVKPPVYSEMYSISVISGLESGGYTPCSIVTVAIDVLNTDFKYIGLLLYAVEEHATGGRTRTKIGSFTLPPDADPMFWTPAGCGGRALMHKDAGEKWFHHEFKWRAPVAGSGRVRFHALLKRGETNTGEFYWPRAAVDLSSSGGGASVSKEGDLLIDEAPTPPPAPLWLRSALGASCAETCTSQTPSTPCDAAAMVAALSKTEKEQLVDGQGPGATWSCRAPLFTHSGEACDDAKRALTSNDRGDCWTRDTSDASCPAASLATVCTVTSPGVSRFCACGRAASATPAIACSHLASWPGAPPQASGTFDTGIYKGNVTDVEVSVKLTLDGGLGRATIEISGPMDSSWFGVAFGAKQMAEQPYAIIIEQGKGSATAGITERVLGVHAEGIAIAPSIAVVRTEVVDGRKTITLVRGLTGLTSDHYSFALGGSDDEQHSLSVLLARGLFVGTTTNTGKTPQERARQQGLILGDPTRGKPFFVKPSTYKGAPNTKGLYTYESGSTFENNAFYGECNPPPCTAEEENAPIIGREATFGKRRLPASIVTVNKGFGHHAARAALTMPLELVKGTSDGSGAQLEDLRCPDETNGCGGGSPRLRMPNDATATLTSSGMTGLTLLTTLALLGEGGVAPRGLVARTAFLATLCLGSNAIGMARAHNWMVNPTSRTRGGLSKVRPVPNTENGISVMVGPGQDFQLNWATGHGGAQYFAIVRAGDEDKLALHTDALLNDYLDSAPEGTSSASPSGWLGDQDIYRRYAIRYSLNKDKPNDAKANGYVGGVIGDPRMDRRRCCPVGECPTCPGYDEKTFYQKRIMPGDRGWIERPAHFRCGRRDGHCRGKKHGQYQWVDSQYRNDLRAAYQSKKYPWIVGVMRYSIWRSFPADHDAALVHFPSWAQPGKYLIQFMWRGYYDGLDVLLLSQKSNDIYGSTNSNSQSWRRVEHCQFRHYTFGSSRHRPMTAVLRDGEYDPIPCLNYAINNRWGKKLNGINVVPLTNPPSVRFKNDLNIPWENPDYTGVADANTPDARSPWLSWGTTSDGNGAFLPATAKSLKDKYYREAKGRRTPVNATSMLCYALSFKGNAGVGEAYKTTLDPTDPVFFSTCYFKELTRIFNVDNALILEAMNGGVQVGSAAASTPLMYAFGENKCMSCASAIKARANNVAYKEGTAGGLQPPLLKMNASHYDLTSECRACAAV